MEEFSSRGRFPASNDAASSVTLAFMITTNTGLYRAVKQTHAWPCLVAVWSNTHTRHSHNDVINDNTASQWRHQRQHCVTMTSSSLRHQYGDRTVDGSGLQRWGNGMKISWILNNAIKKMAEYCRGKLKKTRTIVWTRQNQTRERRIGKNRRNYESETKNWKTQWFGQGKRPGKSKGFGWMTLTTGQDVMWRSYFALPRTGRSGAVWSWT